MSNYGYELIDPRDNLPFYVGISSEPEVRYFAHLTGHGYNLKKDARIQEITEMGMEPILRVVEGPTSRSQIKRWEMLKIHAYESQGIPLTNIVHSQTGRGIPWERHPFARMLTAKEAGWKPRKVLGDDLFWLWDLHVKRMKIEQSPNEELLNQFLDSIPSHYMQNASDKVIFKIAMLSS